MWFQYLYNSIHILWYATVSLILIIDLQRLWYATVSLILIIDLQRLRYATANLILIIDYRLRYARLSSL
jgi:hypothetical protein